MTQPLRIGMIGYGFMGRAHTNGYKRVGDFFPELKYRPVLQAACAREKPAVIVETSAIRVAVPPVIGMR